MINFYLIFTISWKMRKEKFFFLVNNNPESLKKSKLTQSLSIDKCPKLVSEIVQEQEDIVFSDISKEDASFFPNSKLQIHSDFFNGILII